MKKVYALLICSCIALTGFSQSCLPEGIYFYTQNEIDSFQVNHPYCTQIEGEVGINGYVINLNGLSGVTAISGDLRIEYTSDLIDLTGLDNLMSVGGDVYISNNESLVNLTGLGGLITVDGSLNITSNSLLTNLSGLNNLTSINTLYIYDNESLSDLEGLDNFTSIGQLIVQSNSGLVNLIGLDNLITIGDLWALENPNLTSLAGLENITTIQGGLELSANEMLTDLTALGSLTNISNRFWIEGNSSLSTLTGLNNLTTIGSNLYINYNPLLTDLTGLNSLNSIGTDLKVIGNNSLENFNGLNALTYIGGLVEIGSIYGEPNPILTSLTGLENVEAGSIDNLIIRNNPLLSTCDVQSICDYLASPNGTIEIHDNATGCNSQAEVEAACLNAQVYQEFPNIDGYWKERFISVICLDIHNVNPICSEYQYILTGDTIINTELYHKLSYSGRDRNPIDETWTYWDMGYYGCYRNDIENKKVYYIEQDQSNEVLLYDFNLNLNDTLPESFIYNRSEYGIITVDSIDSVLITDTFLKRYHLDGAGFDDKYLIEGIGSTLGLLTPIIPFFEEDYTLTCFINEEENLNYSTGGYYDCDIITHVDDKSSSVDQITVSPNPSTTTITISQPATSQKNTTLNIYNINGQQLLSRQITDQQTVVDVSRLPQGVYFVRITNDRTVQVGKFVKQ